MPSNIYIGTSGWIYQDWNTYFYPHKTKNKLAYYSKYFKTVEVNYTFYQMPDKKTVLNWSNTTPRDFSFSIKLNRYFTHMKRLNIDNKTIERLSSFLQTFSFLGKKFNALLIQLPPSEKFNPMKFIVFLKALNQKLDTDQITVAVEPRHNSWFCDEYYHLINQYGCTAVAAIYPDRPPPGSADPQTRYFRFHGKHSLFDYSNGLLAEWGKYFTGLSSCAKQDLLIYFNNDQRARSAVNALELKKILGV